MEVDKPRMRWSTKVTRYPMRGVGKLSSPGKISVSSFFVSPSFLSRFMSWFEILDLSHSENSKSSAAIGEVCLESLARGGINVSVGEVGEEQGCRSFVVTMEVFEER
jgi:hypothetical protein